MRSSSSICFSVAIFSVSASFLRSAAAGWRGAGSGAPVAPNCCGLKAIVCSDRGGVIAPAQFIGVAQLLGIEGLRIVDPVIELDEPLGIKLLGFQAHAVQRS